MLGLIKKVEYRFTIKHNNSCTAIQPFISNSTDILDNFELIAGRIKGNVKEISKPEICAGRLRCSIYAENDIYDLWIETLIEIKGHMYVLQHA